MHAHARAHKSGGDCRSDISLRKEDVNEGKYASFRLYHMEFFW